MAVGVPSEVSAVAEGAVAGATGCCAVAIGPGDQGTACWGVAEGAGACTAVAVDVDDNVAEVTAGAKSDAGDAAMVFDGVIGEVRGVGGMAGGAVGGNGCSDGINNCLSCAAMAGCA